MRCIILAITMFCFVTISPALGEDGLSLDPTQNIYSARQLGMGGVSVAFADDADGVFSNPACLTNLEFPKLTGTSRKILLDETQYTLIGLAVPTDWGTFGLGFSGMNTGGALPTKLDPGNNRVIIDPSREATSYYNNVIALAYSRQIKDSLSLGGNIKFFNQGFSGDLNDQASGTGLDLGLTFTPRRWAKIGANLQNLVEAQLAWNDNATDKIGGFYKLGCQLNILGPIEESFREYPAKLSAGIDFSVPHNTLATSTYSLGLEYFPQDKIALRTGLGSHGLSFGVGVINAGFRFDYAYAPRSGIPGDSPQYFTLSYVGERVRTTHYSLKEKQSGVIFLEPQDRLITDRTWINISAEAKALRVMDKKYVYTVTAISATHEVSEVTSREPFAELYFNKQPVEPKQELSTAIMPLNMGRNIFGFYGKTVPEAVGDSKTKQTFTASSEIGVLRVAPFADVPLSYWAKDAIYSCSTLGLIKGYPENMFKPDKGISRAELITLLVRTLPVNLDHVDNLAVFFTDVPETHWGAKFIAYGVSQKYATGYPDGSFKPNNTLTRAEGVTILARYAGLQEEPDAQPSFPDLSDSFWGNKFVTPAKAAGLLQYLDGENFEPSKPFSRAEACEILFRTARIQGMVDQWWKTGIVSAQQPTAIQSVPAKEITTPVIETPTTEVTVPIPAPAAEESVIEEPEDSHFWE
ncbi:MAG: S-layer homology domain-containing protein [bacterium]